MRDGVYYNPLGGGWSFSGIFSLECVTYCRMTTTKLPFKQVRGMNSILASQGHTLEALLTKLRAAAGAIVVC